MNDGSIIRVRREKSTDESDEECYTDTSSDEEENEEEKQNEEAEATQEEPIKEKTPEPEGKLRRVLHHFGFYADDTNLPFT